MPLAVVLSGVLPADSSSLNPNVAPAPPPAAGLLPPVEK
jgi:hypothetical protein